MRTLEALVMLGFIPVRSAFGDDALLYDFGENDFAITATEQRSIYGLMQVQLDGIFSNGRILAEIDHKLPDEVESCEKAAAILAKYVSVPLENPPIWLVEGRANPHLLPWLQAGRPAGKEPPTAR